MPLSDAALDVLRRARALGTTGLLFPSAGRKRPLTDLALMQLLRRTGLAGETTVHGLRASFRTWSQEQTDTPWAVAEAALPTRSAPRPSKHMPDQICSRDASS